YGCEIGSAMPVGTKEIGNVAGGKQTRTTNNKSAIERDSESSGPGPIERDSESSGPGKLSPILILTELSVLRSSRKHVTILPSVLGGLPLPFYLDYKMDLGKGKRSECA
ncbi:hypothetical protein BHE74_00059401, partial [Ensete ventricosum]